MKGKNRVRVEEGLFERRKAEKQRSRDEDRRALESGLKSREQLRQENELFSGMKTGQRPSGCRGGMLLAALRGYLGRPVGRGGTTRTGSSVDDLVAAAR